MNSHVELWWLLIPPQTSCTQALLVLSDWFEVGLKWIFIIYKPKEGVCIPICKMFLIIYLYAEKEPPFSKGSTFLEGIGLVGF